MIICGTGHRPDKLGGYSDEVFYKLVGLAREAIQEQKAIGVISGMALGWDQALAHAAIVLRVPFVACIPFKGQERSWPNDSQARYNHLMEKAHRIIVACDGGYAAWKMQKRNELMVDNAQLVVALWNGTSGGTGNCIRYANSTGTPIANYWDRWLVL